MSVKYSSGKWAHGFCDRCSQRFQLKDLKKLTIKTKVTNILVCKSCWDYDHPQLLLGLYPVYDPQALRNPRPDTSYYQSGLNTLQYPEDGSRVFQWGWAPVGGASQFDAVLTPNYLVAKASVGTVTITT
jgi:hypothetical protein